MGDSTSLRNPAHRVTLTAFAIDVHQQGTGLNWFQARQRCQSRGGDLPTEAQWERAARLGRIVVSSKVDWVFDWYHDDYYKHSGGYTNPSGPGDGGCQSFPGNWRKYKKSGDGPCCRVFRGGAKAWKKHWNRLTQRGFWGPGQGASSRGYRCAKSL